jgi:FMN phosphatase YigB (HAD superfamily)
MIKAIFFDAAGILYTRAGPTEAYALNLLHNQGFATELPPDRAARLLELRSQANQGIINHDAYWDQFLRMRGVIDSQQRKDFSTQIIYYSNNILPIPGGREALAGLKQQGFLLGIITDTIYPVEWKMRRLEKAGVAEFIDIVACSTELGAHKPDPAVYSYAIKQAHLSEGESAFVGHLGVELDGAHKAGMITIAIDQDVNATADYYCNSLLDLLTLPILRR